MPAIWERESAKSYARLEVEKELETGAGSREQGTEAGAVSRRVLPSVSTVFIVVAPSY